MMKLERILQEIERTKENITKQQAHLKELEAQKTEVENLQIVQMVRALRMTPAELSAFLQKGRAATPTPVTRTAPATPPAAAKTAAVSSYQKKQEDTDNE